MDKMFETISNEDLLKVKADNPGNKSIASLVDGIIAGRLKVSQELAARRKEEDDALMAAQMQEAQEALKGLRFSQELEAMLTPRVIKSGKDTINVGLGRPPANIHNVLLSWKVEDVDDTTKPEVVEVVKTNPASGKPETGPDGKPIMVKETRYPKLHLEHWVAEPNKIERIISGSSGDKKEQGTSKRAITVHKRNGTNLVFVGNFKSGSDACKHLNLVVGGDSPIRVLEREGFIHDPYAGTDYTIGSYAPGRV